MKVLRILTLFFVLACLTGCDKEKKGNTPTTPATPTVKVEKLKILVWNIQNGMWADQGNDYENFVTWVMSYKPDVCIWCEAKSNYKTGSKTAIPKNENYLPDGWGELAQRYGHDYWSKGGHRDNFPQVITSKYPITNVNAIVGDSEVVVSHGAGHFRINVSGKQINFVSLHTWPQKYAYGIDKSEQTSSIAANGGDYYRLKEVTYICENTIGKAKDPENEWWLMAGDFNARSSLDNATYGYSLSDTRFLVHDYVLENTPYKDVIKEMHQGEFKTTTSGTSRIDFVYCSPAMMENVSYADVLRDYWVGKITQDSTTGFKMPSDHRPIYLEVKLQ